MCYCYENKIQLNINKFFKMKYKFYPISLVTLIIVSTQLSPAFSTPVTPIITPIQRPTPKPSAPAITIPIPQPSTPAITVPAPKPSTPAIITPAKEPNNTTTTAPPKEIILFTQTGQASWYGYEGGSVTATGERYNPQAMTAAHNTRSGRSAIVTINDRGPFVRGRIIDLSAAAAEAVGIKSSGVGNVRIEVLSYGSKKRQGSR
jgi:rare lipoprotein A (peptidoglycan hydrolase)